MTTYLGPSLGSLVPVECLPSISTDIQERLGESFNLANRRRLYISPPGEPHPRSWTATVDADPATLTPLVELEALRVPLWMVSEEAQVSNILMPNEALGLPVRIGPALQTWRTTRGGPVRLQGGDMAAISAIPTQNAVMSGLQPVEPGVPVSLSVFVRASISTANPAIARIDWMDPAEDFDGPALGVGEQEQSTQIAAPLDLLEMTATPPAGVYAARITLLDAGQFARPCLTWTPDPQPWREGMGANSVYLSPMPWSGIIANRAVNYSSFEYMIREVLA